MGLSRYLIFPGHRYLGPGNKLNNGPPVDMDDLIAQTHDLAYENAFDKEDVHIADEKAIFSFAIDWLKNKNWHSAIGALGLGLKHLVEVMCGRVFYPKLYKKKKI